MPLSFVVQTPFEVGFMLMRVFTCTTLLLAGGMIAGCSSSFGSGGGSAPARTYVVMPNGEAVPAQTTTRPPG